MCMAEMISSSLSCSSLSGASFTRFQTLRLQKIFPESLANQLISYGSCQFPTLGFVVERFKAIQSFIPETFYKIKGTPVSMPRLAALTEMQVFRSWVSLLFAHFVLWVCLCLSAAWGGGKHCRVQLEKKPSLPSHSLPGSLPDLHGGMWLFLCVYLAMLCMHVSYELCSTIT